LLDRESAPARARGVAGIVAGKRENGFPPHIEGVLIRNGNIEAIARYGPGIGAGPGLYGNSTTGNITILNGSVTARGHRSSGIGSNHVSSAHSIITTLLIVDCRNEKNGTSSIYYADFTNEMLFHIPPLIPSE
jgi:hypothetical protein